MVGFGKSVGVWPNEGLDVAEVGVGEGGWVMGEGGKIVQNQERSGRVFDRG